MATEPSTTVPLWDGAFTASLPSSFKSISDITQSPDNQEVLLDSANSTSLIIELTQRVPDVDLEPADFLSEDDGVGLAGRQRSDLAVLRHHVADLTAQDREAGGILHTISRSEKVEAGASTPWPTYIYLAHMHPPPVQPTNIKATEKVRSATLAIALARAVPADGDESRASDVLVTVSVRYEDGMPDWQRLYAPEVDARVKRALEVREAFLRSLTLHDEGLFGED
ncbi:Mog1p/PsbP-like protein [Myriangium duriaei CBS 260.36]|uniref:Mog1p/PsbP-like protein n=1 Tax=Myriangium duriaei CBS 260.36 TaxID=1168546 RepID=A0A9P4IWL7_9PEZI|nr:Mog1p/PsbP-like protein [Myriangium duriaei CBS 260.36]